MLTKNFYFIIKFVASNAVNKMRASWGKNVKIKIDQFCLSKKKFW